MARLQAELASARAGKRKYKAKYLELKEEVAEDEQKSRAQLALPFHQGAAASVVSGAPVTGLNRLS